MGTIAENLTGRLELDIRPWLAALKKAQNASASMANQVERDSKKITYAHRSMWKKIGAASKVAMAKMRIGMAKVRAGAARLRATLHGVKGAVLGLGAALGLALGGAAIAMEAKKMSAAGAEFEETFAKFEAVFKEFRGDATAWANEFATEVGRSKTEVMDWMARLQDTFVPLGFARSEAAKLSSQITRLGVDLASFNNMVDQDVIENLTSAIVGQHIAVRKYGIVLNEASLNQELFNMGVVGGVNAATNLQKVQARLNVIMNATTDAQGDAVRTAASFTNQMKRLGSAITQIRSELGMELNKEILKLVNGLGGAEAVSRRLKVVFTLVVEVAKLFVLWVGYMSASNDKYAESAKGAEAASLRMAAKVKRLGVGLSFVWHVVSLLTSGLRILFDGLIGALQIVWTLIKNIVRAIGGSFLKALARVGIVISDLVTSAAYLGDLVGISDDAASKWDKMRSTFQSMDKMADQFLSGFGSDWDGVGKTADDARNRWRKFGIELEAQRNSMREMSGEIASLERQAAEAEGEAAKEARKARRAQAKGVSELLNVKLNAEQKAAQESMILLRDSLHKRINEVKATELRIQTSYKETITAFKKGLSELENAYKEHSKRLKAIDQERSNFNLTMEERIFRLRMKGLSPEEQSSSLQSAMQEMEFRARMATSAGDFSGAKGFLERAAGFAEEIAELEPNLIGDMASRMSEIAKEVNKIFGYEEQFHRRAAREALDRKVELAAQLEELEASQKAWSESFKKLLKQWSMLNQQQKEDLDRFDKEMTELTKPRQVLINAITGPALAAIQEVKEALNGLRSTPIVITTPRLPLDSTPPVQGAGEAPIKKAFGGWVPGTGTKDSVPAMLAPGEFVVQRAVAQQFPGLLEALNQGAGGDTVNVGDVNVTLTGSGSSEQDAVAIGKALRREIRRGRVTLN